ncbi:MULTISPECIES: hypothetical protein [unclassified Serratia (in: enterobacteria)]|uniref:DUF7706 family protein n=1 Tax=unclassified Serratia (in: enterobacteria) TaxID=2647522 RepID=UPI000501EACA|nr:MULTISPECIES: hypothetical protein [unclassified Serratia (in: enterobacteria)]KFK96508.1 hypothetical protein JV45_05435 [Serratia sp. Ag2]KFK96510.1 hypothetical protein JV45_05455 [Serratia sp. Ag2]KFK99983.1 hypothetical protein IV04_05315 [Serratia sp. Ag1]KFK99985.1 hypothetical protein IV04_05335 [Serratia sp. Ag1]
MEYIIINGLELTTEQAWALAQFFKRVSWNEMRVNARNDNEYYSMCDAINQLRKTLAEQGYAAR